MKEIIGNSREAALAALEEKAEKAYEAWSEGLMPDDLYNLRMSQIREQKTRIESDVAFFQKGR